MPSPPSPRGRARWVVPALALAAATYAGTLDHGFVWDDHELIEQGRLIRDTDNAGRLFTTDFWANAYPDERRAGLRTNVYRPLVSLSLMLSWRLHGPKPLGYHVENLVLHLLCVLLVFLVWARASGEHAAAAWAAAIYAVLPVHTEAVAWISGRADLLTTACSLGALWCWLLARRARGLRDTAWLAAACTLYGAALLCKEAAAVLPALVLVWEGMAAPGDVPWSRRLLRLGWLVVVAFLYLGVRGLALGGGRSGLELLAPSAALLQSLPAAATYLSWVLLPHTLTVARTWVPPSVTIQMLVLLAVAAAAVALVLARRRSPQPRLFGLVWFVVAIAPPVAITLLSGDMAERYTYLPAAGIAWWLGQVIQRFLATWTGSKLLARGLLAAIFALLLLRSATRVEDWESDATLFLAAYESDPDNPEAAFRLGTHIASWGEVAAATKLLSHALVLRPTEPRYANNLAVVLLRRGEAHAARHVLLRVLPHAGSDPRFHYNLALVEQSLGHLAKARSRVEVALLLAPSYEDARRLLAELDAARSKRPAQPPEQHE